MSIRGKTGFDLDQLLHWGRNFDLPHVDSAEETWATWLAHELLRIRDRNGGENPLVANAVQAEFARRRQRQNIIVKARQMGMTTWVAGRFFLKTITARGVMTVQVAHTRDAAESIFRIVQRFWECLPEEMRKGPLKRSRANVGQMIFPELDSEFRVLTASDANAGRGLTVQNMHLSEVSRWPGDASATLAGMRAALVPTGELVLESTPNGAFGCFYEEWQQAEENGIERHFFPWWMEPAYVASEVTDLNDEEQELVQKHRLSPAQIGFRRTLEAGYRNLRAQEFAEDAELCFRSSGDCYFDVDTLETRLKTVEAPMSVHRGGRLHIFLTAQPGKEYIVAIDPAGGGSAGDYAVVEVIDLETGAQCAELQQRLKPLELSRAAAGLAAEYSTPGKPALIVVERNNHGHGVLAHLQQGSSHYERIYDSKGVPGWLTTSSSKQQIVSDLDALLVEQPELFRGKRLLEECRTFMTRANGSTGAASGAHDDCVMAFAIAQAVRKELRGGKNKA
jgi:hypothetical protein